MYSLFLDLSFDQACFALFQDGAVLCSVIVGRDRSHQPCALWDELLTQQRLKLVNIDCFSCGIGPGSYTGIRNAAATAQASSYVTKKPIVAVPSLLRYVPDALGVYRVALPGGFGGIFTQRIEHSEHGFILGQPEQIPEKDFVVQSDERLIGKEKIYLSTIAKFVDQEWHKKNLYDSTSLPLQYLRKTQAELSQSQQQFV